jgi:hypothetical protein
MTLTALVDWRVAGYTSDMTKNLYDEGGNSRDYDEASPTQSSARQVPVRLVQRRQHRAVR